MIDLYAKLGVRDGLAAERTRLAAERTFLAYFRTALAMLVAGVSGASLLDDPTLEGVGYVLSVGGLALLIVGAVRFLQSLRLARQMLERLIVETRNEPAA